MISMKNSLFKQFTIFSSIAFIITGTVLGVLISNHVRGVFEVYTPDYELKQHIAMLNRLIIIVMFSGLLNTLSVSFKDHLQCI